MAQRFLPNAPQIIYHILLNTHESPCPATQSWGISPPCYERLQTPVLEQIPHPGL